MSVKASPEGLKSFMSFMSTCLPVPSFEIALLRSSTAKLF